MIMNVKKMYVPDPQKWINFYETMDHSRNSFLDNDNKRNPKNQVGGSLNGTPKQFMIPVGKMSPKNRDSSDNVQVKMISPSEQFLEQAKEEVIEKKSNKRNAYSAPVSSSKRPRRDNTSWDTIRSKGKSEQNKKARKQTNHRKPIPKDIFDK